MHEYEKKVYKQVTKDEKKVLDDLKKLYLLALLTLKEDIYKYSQGNGWDTRIYQKNYQVRLAKQIDHALRKLHSQEYKSINEYLKDSYTDGFVGAVYSMHNQDVPLIIPLNEKLIIRAMTTDSQLSEGLYEELGIDVDDMKKVIAGEISRGIATNMPYGEISRNISSQMNIRLSHARTIVLTEAHRIRESAAQDARFEAKQRGANVLKQWDATMDGRTRKTHRKLDGQIREIDQPFEVDGKTAMQPGGFGLPEEDINCRCISLTRARWAMDEAELERLRKRADFWELDKTQDFHEFKIKYLNAVKKAK